MCDCRSRAHQLQLGAPAPDVVVRTHRTRNRTDGLALEYIQDAIRHPGVGPASNVSETGGPSNSQAPCVACAVDIDAKNRPGILGGGGFVSSRRLRLFEPSSWRGITFTSRRARLRRLRFHGERVERVSRCHEQVLTPVDKVGFRGVRHLPEMGVPQDVTIRGVVGYEVARNIASE
jgi:hypothetical protein